MCLQKHTMLKLLATVSAVKLILLQNRNFSILPLSLFDKEKKSIKPLLNSVSIYI